MRFPSRKLFALFVAVLIVIAAGCIGGEEGSTTNTSYTSEPAASYGELELSAAVPDGVEGPFNVTVTLKNLDEHSIRVAKFSYYITVRFELYNGTGNKLPFRGPVPTYLPLTKEDTVVLKPGESLSASFQVDPCWWASGPEKPGLKSGKYRFVVIYDTKDVMGEGVSFWRGVLRDEKEVYIEPANCG